MFECSAIFRGMIWIPGMVVTSSAGIVPSGKWGPKRWQMNWLDMTNLYQLWEQLGVNNGDGVPSELVLINLLSARFAPWAAWLIGRSRCYYKSRQGYGHWLSKVGVTNSMRQIARSLDEWSRDPLIWQGWLTSGMHCLCFDVVFKQTCQSGQMFFHLSDVMPEFFLTILYGADLSFQTISHTYP